MARTAILNVMVQAALKAGRALARDFGEVANLQVSMKGPGDFVSAADRRAEEILLGELSRARPTYGILAEESVAVAGKDDARWLVDPLDGTTNFLHSIPIFAISIALEREGELVAGVVFNPVLNELFVAEKGSGAFLNDRRMRVAARTKLADSVIGTGIPHLGRGEHAPFIAELGEVMRNASGVRRCGSASIDLAWLAAGRFDGFWERTLRPWDMAAGIVLIREAGGIVTDLWGKSDMLGSGTILAGNHDIHRGLAGILEKARQTA